MSLITYVNPNMTSEGLNIDSTITITDALAKLLPPNTPQPSPISIKAQIDTGASHCVIRDGIPQKLGLKPIGQTFINTPSHQNHPCYQYFMRLQIPYNNTIIPYEAIFTAAPLIGQNIDCLIGRDLLSQTILIYIGYTNQFTLGL